MTSTTKYKLRRTFRLWDVLTVGGVGVAMAVLCIWAMLTPQDMELHGWVGLSACAASSLGVVVALFWARWKFWRRIEYVTEHGIGVMSVWPHKGRSNIEDGWPRDEHGALLPLDERAGVEDVTEATLMWWILCSRSPYLARHVPPHLAKMLNENIHEEWRVRRAVWSMVLIWEPCPFEDVRRGRFWRWVVDLALAETMRVSWKPDVWSTTLYHAMGHSILHLCANFYGEDRTHKLFADLGYNRENVRAS
jgi:hypothetical protein